MKKLFLIVFILLTCNALAQQTDWEKYDLKGKVKKVTAHTPTYVKDCNWAKEKPVRSCISEFSPEGKLLKNTWLDHKKTTLQVQHFSYQDGKTILKVDLYDKGKRYDTKTFEYQDEEELEHYKSAVKIIPFSTYKQEILYSYGDLPILIYKYDKQGNWIYKHDPDLPDKGICKRTNTRIIEYY